ncbi:MAG: sugar ABC transporter ATP-binding protein [Tannerellaceae bacterium]|jgi:ribose transport system ATP-binding protein|nr:sugar ABC transporter ATP-binding protein [Tannerellaceae bacterium]
MQEKTGLSRDELLKISHLDKSFGVVKALKDVGFAINYGEIHGLIGENGSGKSTLSSIVAGMQKADNGEMTFLGSPYKPENSIEASAAGVCMVLQEIGTISGISVMENLFLGNGAKFSKYGFMNLRKMNTEAESLLESLQMHHLKPNTLVDYYSFEERKLLEIARAVYNNPRLLIIDETTTALSINGRQILYRLIKKLAGEGKSVLFISHDLDELMKTCDVLTVLRDGVFIDTIPKEKYETNDIKMKMVGRIIEGDYYRSDYDCTFGDEIALKMVHVCTENIYDINLELHKGEILGISGLSESGIHDLGRLAYGIDEPVYGRATHGKDNAPAKKKLSAKRRKAGYVSKDRDKESLILNDNIRNNIAINAYDYVKMGPFIMPNKEKSYVQKQIDNMRIKCFGMNQMVNTLSGGNKQKVAFARWIGVDTEILILDCPTRGVDIGVKTSMYQLMTRLKKDGKSLLIISEELSELIGMCDRILVVKDGKITKEFSRGRELSEHQIIDYMI